MRRFNNLSTLVKLLISFGWIIFFLVISTYVSNRNIKRIAESEFDLVEANFASIHALGHILSNQNYNRSILLEMIINHDPESIQACEKLIKERIANNDSLMKSIDPNKQTIEFQNQFKSLKDVLASYRIDRNLLIDLIKEGKMEEARQKIFTTQKQYYLELISIRQKMETDAIQASMAQLAADQKTAGYISLFQLFLGIAIICFTIFVVIILNRTIARPLEKLTEIASKVAVGNLKFKQKSMNREDEIGKLDKTFSQMIQYLQHFVTEINEGVNLLASSSTQILAATSQVATGTAQTATAISETSTTVEEVQQASKQSSLIANNVSNNSLQAAQISQKGQKAVDETINGMNNIRMQMDSIAQTVVRLSEQSQSIGGIIAAVTDIADQSNLLAVNAAIEAAKAGEQGKGFAVVAQEIKNLAGQSKQSTLQVRNILNDIQKVTTAAVLATEQGSNAVASGLQQSMVAEEVIRVLAESINEAMQSATQIVASSQQQVIGMDQIGVAMQNINQAGTETAVSMVQAEKSARNLFELGQKLKTMTEMYKL